MEEIFAYEQLEVYKLARYYVKEVNYRLNFLQKKILH